MDIARDNLAGLALAHAWQLTLLIVVVVFASRLTRNRPHLAYMLWLLVLIKCVTPPVWSSPASVFSWLESATHAAANDLHMRAAGDHPLRAPIDRLGPATAMAPEYPPAADPAKPAAADRLPPLGPADRRAGFSLLVAVGWIWAGGAGLALLASGWRFGRCLRRLRRAKSIKMPGLEAQLEDLVHRLHVKQPVRLNVTSSHLGPAVIGMLRPVIVLPEIVVRGKQPGDLEAILSHELIHVRRGDLWLGVLQVFAQALWWFHPLVFWATRMSTREAERCCDEEVVGELGCDPRRYAHSLLDVLELKRTLQPVPTFPGMKPVEVTSQRLERIMKLGQGCHRQTPTWCWALMLLLSTACLPGAAFIAADDKAKDAGTLPHGATAPQTEQTGGKRLLGTSVRSDAGVKGAVTIDKGQLSVDAADVGQRPGGQAKTLRVVREKLATKGAFRFTDRPLYEVIEQMEAVAGLNLRIDTDALAREGLALHSEVTLHSDAPISVQEALNRLCTPNRLRHLVEGERVAITGRVPERVYTKLYNVQDLLESDLATVMPQELAQQTFDAPARRDFAILGALIKERVGADAWGDRGGIGALSPFPQNLSLIVRHTATAHAKVAACLNALRKKFGLPEVAVQTLHQETRWPQPITVVGLGAGRE